MLFAVLRETGLGKSFFGGVAQPEPLRNILRQVPDACVRGCDYHSFFSSVFYCSLLLSSPPSNFNLYFHFYSSSSSPSACLTTLLNSLSSSPLHTYSHTFTTYLLILFLLHIYTSLTLILTPSPLYLSTPLLLCIFLLLFTSPTLYLTSFLLSLLSLIKAYGDPKSVDDETLNFILQPGLLEGAADVFLDFISYR